MLTTIKFTVPDLEKKFREIQDLYSRLRDAILDLNISLGIEAELTAAPGNANTPQPLPKQPRQ